MPEAPWGAARWNEAVTTWGLMTLVALAGGLWLWQDTMAARERATAACRRACRDAGVQLLDDTVVLEGLSLSGPWGQWVVERRYGFEFTDTGASRRPGLVVVRGQVVTAVALDGVDLLVV